MAESRAAPPKGLACLTQWYRVTPEWRDGRWYGVLPDGTALVWNDGRVKTPDERFTSPDLKDMFFAPYLSGAIRPVQGEGDIDEPGRARVEQLFKATYGATAWSVSQRMRKIEFFGKRYSFHPLAHEPLKRVIARLERGVRANRRLGIFLRDIGGTWNWRTIAKSKTLSTHAWGIAIDLSVKHAHYWQWQRPKTPLRWANSFPQEIVDAFEAEGFIWGGRWLHYDTMHFEYRPELLDSSCR
ncbi:MAG: M15 family metallopeptidase [Myxococcaceae bacterium]|nr:M15 family metallopeptidase [Myxococcaceae bacterium]